MLELIESEQVTITCAVPTMLIALMEHPDFERRDLSSLRRVFSGGTLMPPLPPSAARAGITPATWPPWTGAATAGWRAGSRR